MSADEREGNVSTEVNHPNSPSSRSVIEGSCTASWVDGYRAGRDIKTSTWWLGFI